MADDHNARYRSGDSYGHEPGRAGPGNDPLAELARLIGKSDPFAELDRAAAANNAAQHYAEPQHPQYAEPQYPQYANEPAPNYAPAPDYAPAPNDSPAQGYPSAPPPLRPLPNFGSDPLFGEPLPPRHNDLPPRYADHPAQQPDWPPGPAVSQPFEHDPFALPSAASAQHSQHPAEPRFDSQGFGAPPPMGGNFQPDLPGFGPPPFQAGSDRPPFAPPLYPSEPDAGAMPPPHDDEFYDDAPRNERRKGMVTVLAVLGLAVLGTAAAFGYRSLFGGPSASSPPPIIRANNEPAKVAPPQTATVDPNARINYDRFGDRSQNEQVVVREEKPINTGDLARSAAPRVVIPSGPSLTSPPQAQSGGNPPGTIGEPRRVRTVPIRPEGTEPAVPSQQAMTVSPPAPQRQPATTASNTPLDVTPSGVSRQPAPPQTRTAARTPPPEPVRPPTRAATPSANAPLSLSPDGNLPPPAAAMRDTPPPRATRQAAVSSGGGGRYLVQVSSQRSEADAQAAYRNIQSRYSNVLGGHGHTVRRADLGSKGVYYRAMVGPFGTRDEAIQVCTSLKAAGGDCVVQSN